MTDVSISTNKAAVKAGETFTALVEFDNPVSGLGTGNFKLYDTANGQKVEASGRVTSVVGENKDGTRAPAETLQGAYTRYWRVTITANADVTQSQCYLGMSVDGTRNSRGPVEDPTIYKSNSVFIDGAAPAISSAVANGTRLTLVYSDAGGSGLDADHDHAPAASAFRVTAGGAENTVTAVLVDTAANTVTLTLTRAVATGQTVLVSYTDPTAGDDANAVQDRAGNDAASFSDRVVTVSTDNTAPTMAAVDPIAFDRTAMKSGQKAFVTFKFSEAVRGFDLDDVVVPEGCTLSNLEATSPTDGASTTWRAMLIGKPGVVNANYTLTVKLSGVQDTAGNAGSGTSDPSPAIAVDTRLPAILAVGGIVISKTTLKAGETTEVVFTFNMDIVPASFTNDDFHLADGWSITNPIALSNGSGSSSFKATLTPPPDKADAATTITVYQDRVTKSGEGGGNGESSAISVQVSANTVRPTLVSSNITFTDDDLRADQTSTVTFTFSEAVSGFGSSDVRAENGTLTNFQALDADGNVITTPNTGSTKWRATLTPTDKLLGPSNKLTVDLTGVTNAAGNTGAGSVESDNYKVDTHRPMLSNTVFSNTQTLKTGESTTVTFSFSEAVSGFGINDVTGVPGGTLSNLYALSDSNTEMGGTNPSSANWRATLTATAGEQTAAGSKLTVNLAGVTNTAGNAGAGPVESNNGYTIDARAPTLAATDIHFDKTTLKVGETSTTVTFTFSEAVSGFTASAVTGYEANATLTGLHAVNPATGSNASTTWSATLTALSGKQSATNTLNVSLTGVTDAVGYHGTGSVNSANYVVDTVLPTVSSFVVTRSQTDGHTPTYQVRLVFSEKVSGLTAGKLSAPNASILNLETSDEGTTWTATLTTNANVEDASNKVQLTLAGVTGVAGVTDVAGNAFASAMAESDNYVVDSKAPVFERAAVNGNQLVLYYSDGGSLNAVNKAAPGRFAVRADGVINSVTEVTVDAAAKTVTLSLADSVAHGQAVTVTYADPTAGDDVGATQDAAGNDAASLAAQTVTNNTPAPIPPPAPAPAPAPDSDSDGVANNVEDKAPGLAGAQPGDGNGDGIPDSRQGAVASSSFVTGPKGASEPAGLPTSYTTLVAGGQNGKPAADDSASTHITALLQQDTPAWLPKALEMPTGLTSFNAQLGTGLTSETFSLYVDANLGVNGYWLKNAEGYWVNLASEAYGGKMQTEGGRLRLDFQIADGSEFDADGLTDGAITAAGAAAHMALSVLGQAPDEARDGFWL